MLLRSTPGLLRAAPATAPRRRCAPPMAGAGAVSVAVVGDLHLDPTDLEAFYEAREQLRGHLLSAETEGFDDFVSDDANLAAWRATFDQHHHWARRAGPLLLIGLSTVRFRDAPGSCHEVFVDAAQLDWFETTLAANRDVPTVVFSHAPPMGCGLRALQAVHVKNRCAWLNHGEAPSGPTAPARFAELAAVNPQLKAWFSGHFHLSHDYEDSVATRGECTFVQVGVIGPTASRDGRRHSRLLRADGDGFDLYTVDHAADGRLRLDLRRRWGGAAEAAPVPVASRGLSPDDAVALKAVWLRAEEACSLEGPHPVWLAAGRSELCVQGNQVIEYDNLTRAPIGVVARAVDGRAVRLVDASGRDAEGVGAVALVLEGGEESLRVPRNANGYFYQVFQENKYKKWLAKQAAAV